MNFHAVVWRSSLTFLLIGLAITFKCAVVCAGNQGDEIVNSLSTLPIDLKEAIFSNSSVYDLEVFTTIDKESSKIIFGDFFSEQFLAHRPYDLLRLNKFRSQALDEIATSEGRKKWVKKLLDPQLQFSEVPAGVFKMGSPPHEVDRYPDEQEHRVSLYTYKFQKNKVSQLLWYLVMFDDLTHRGHNPSWFQSPDMCEARDHVRTRDGVSLCIMNPVESVSWNKIAERDQNGLYLSGTFLGRLRDLFEIDARLPSEAEWERATRGASTQEERDDPRSAFYFPYDFGFNGDDDVNLLCRGWYAKNSENRTHPIGEKGKNSLGLSDMVGGLYEWVDDWYGDYEYGVDVRNVILNPKGPVTGVEKVIRGGSWNSHPAALRSAARMKWGPDEQDSTTSFRIIVRE